MLTKLEIRNFRCFDNHAVYFRPKTVIVGQNNAGKSTVIEALRLVGLAQNRYRSINYTDPPDWLDSVKVGTRGIKPSIERFDLSPEGLFYQYREPPGRINANFSNGTRIELFVGPDFQLFATIFRTKTKAIRSRSEATSVYVPSISILPPLGPLVNRERMLTPETIKRGLGTDLSSLHFRNQIHIYEKYYPEFKSLAESTWPHLQVMEFRHDGRPPDDLFSLLIRDEDFAAEVAWMGSGLKMWLQIMWFLASSGDKRVVILDEPDVYMHPDLQRRLIRILYKAKYQTILTTHSVETLSEVDPEDILIINKRRPESKFATSLGAVQEVIDRMGTGHNIQLSRLWTAKRVLLVEGKDIPLLDRFHSILFSEETTPLGSIPSLPIGGWGGWQRAIGSSEMLKNAAGEKIITYCILDRDYHSDEEISARLKDAANRKIELHIWELKELENYFLVPSVIQRSINTQIEEGRQQVDIATVENSMLGIADELRDQTHDAIATYYLDQNRAGGLSTANKNARDIIKSYWDTLPGRLKIVSGKQVLARLSKWSQDQYGISLSIGSIARCFRPEEVFPEIANVIGSIERGLPFPPVQS
jgi:hypothetical protein